MQRLIGGVSSNWNPLNWLAFNGTLGADIDHRNDNETLPPAVLDVDQTSEDGYRSIERAIITNYTANVNGSATYHYDNFRFVSTVGTQYSDVGFTRTDAFGAKLLAGTSSLAGTTARFSVGETNSDVRTLGFLGREEIGWADKRFLSVAARTDRNSAFGVNFRRVYYPSISGSWVLSDEDFFPRSRLSLVSSLRLRAAMGSAGQNPGYLAAEQFYNPVAVTVNGTDVPAFTVGGAGNPNLKPEKSTETEAGFDLALFHDRVSLEYTHYNKVTRDELVSVPLPPSLGSATSRFQNLGRVSNSGHEAVVDMDLLDRNSFRFDLRLNGSWNSNTLETLGVDENGVPVPQITTGFDDTQIFKAGLPLGAYYVRQITSVNDANHDGMIGCPNGPGSTGLRVHDRRFGVVRRNAVPDRRAQHRPVALARKIRAHHRDVRPPRRTEDLQPHERVPERDLPERRGGPAAQLEQPGPAGGRAGGDVRPQRRVRRGCVVHEAARSRADADAAAAIRGADARRGGHAHDRRAQPAHVEQLHGARSGAQHGGAGELHDHRLPHDAAGAVLHRACRALVLRIIHTYDNFNAAFQILRTRDRGRRAGGCGDPGGVQPGQPARRADP